MNVDNQDKEEREFESYLKSFEKDLYKIEELRKTVYEDNREAAIGVIEQHYKEKGHPDPRGRAEGAMTALEARWRRKFAEEHMNKPLPKERPGLMATIEPK